VFYHVYNQGVNGADLFVERRNYYYFLDLFAKYISPIAETYAYCLLRNHFHFLLRIKEPRSWDKTGQEPRSSEERGSYDAGEEERGSLYVSKQFARFFGTYAKAFNKAYQRRGPLFIERFQRKPVRNEAYFVTLVVYIHRNPQRHGFVADFREWPFSSYRAIVRNAVPGRNGVPTKVAWRTVSDWFGGGEAFREAHRRAVDTAAIAEVVED
jgi:REP element-mobilizing transposase RayT